MQLSGGMLSSSMLQALGSTSQYHKTKLVDIHDNIKVSQDRLISVESYIVLPIAFFKWVNKF